MSDDIGWRFPPTNGGRIDGFNDPGIARFTGAPLASLARETIQNSLDASLAPDKPVHVSFELIELDPDNVGRDELAKAIDASIQTADDDPMASAALKAAMKSIMSDVIPCLRVSDRNTTGLRGNQWRALVKMQGVSQKPEMEGAGGSHGIGKYSDAVREVRNHFFAVGNRALIRDNGVSRLWWLGKIAHDVTPDEPREFLTILLHRQDVRSALIERPSVSMNRRLLRGIYTVMREHWVNGGALFERDAFRSWMVALNRRGGVVLLDALPDDALGQLLHEEADGAVEQSEAK